MGYDFIFQVSVAEELHLAFSEEPGVYAIDLLFIVHRFSNLYFSSRMNL